MKNEGLINLKTIIIISYLLLFSITMQQDSDVTLTDTEIDSILKDTEAFTKFVSNISNNENKTSPVQSNVVKDKKVCII